MDRSTPEIKSHAAMTAVVLIGLILLSTGCMSSVNRVPTQQETDLARSGIVSLLEASAQGAGGWRFLEMDPGELQTIMVPPTASDLWKASQTIPGGVGLQQACLQTTAAAAAEAVFHLIPIATELSALVVPIDPFPIVKGTSDAATTLFSSQYRAKLVQEAAAFLRQPQMHAAVLQAVQAWGRLRTLVAIDEHSKNLISRSGFPVSSNPPVDFSAHVAQAVVTEFLRTMAEQEDLVRATAAFHDDPGIALFASR